MVVFIRFFFFNDTATTEIYTLSLHDALPISGAAHPRQVVPEEVHDHHVLGPVLVALGEREGEGRVVLRPHAARRSEEHTSELQSPCNLVCRLLLEKKKKLSGAFRRGRSDHKG